VGIICSFIIHIIKEQNNEACKKESDKLKRSKKTVRTLKRPGIYRMNLKNTHTRKDDISERREYFCTILLLICSEDNHAKVCCCAVFTWHEFDAVSLRQIL